MKITPLYRSRILFASLILSITTLACALLNQTLPIDQPLTPQSKSNDLIAYLGVDGNLYTIDEHGENRTAITDDARKIESDDEMLRIYSHPTWSFDGRHLAFVSVESQDLQITSRLLVADPMSAEISEVFESNTEFPFYLYWAPDNERISFLSNATIPNGLTFRLAYLNGDESQILDQGQPYYWVWAPDGSEIFIHQGGSSSSNPDARLGTLSPSSLETRDISLSPGHFQAPGWSPDGKYLLAAIENESRGELIQLNKEGDLLQKLADYEATIAFNWSPDGEQIAYLATSAASSGRVGKLAVISTGNADILHRAPEDTVIAYFWAPDSQSVAYFSVQLPGRDQDEISTRSQDVLWLDLKILNITTGETHRLSTFQLGSEFLSTLTFFDQYHHSATIWSPDSAKLVYATDNPDGVASIWVVDADGESQALRIAEGTLAFWSWK
ncbi:MAG: PD40 domain-containing protein [Anaerolineales bacterium]|uniref:PD40 domain-containing protein n=1 Tax=Candidatus Desulfolinea nitratireducens TaxID=2841698 RepID=A0A8J6NIB8_9CHLR|nr:PD40 domain-containing protein [Candidatus Desulfolinea nitratireducens]MBL6960511.1 PD40 domain-containing protein [Anaerolineales bacterium]